ncbi:hypothetical protein LTR27_011833 [Elasticomyces elasticus]|nr:hypothetical protein LTR27_011833 [Elasticomyces elasticus]
MDKTTLHELLNFNIDHYISPIVPRSRLYLLPQPFRHFLGHRKTPHVEPPTLLQWPLMFIATLAGLTLVAGIYNYAPGIAKLHPPVMIASLGASAILDYNAIRSPLAQPRNVIIGHGLSAIVGVSISKLFQHNPTFFADYAWVSGSVGCACASLVMSLTNTVHPPGGATAVLASTEALAVALGWHFVWMMLLASALMTTVACLFNNIIRQYPVYWWTPEDVGSELRKQRREKQDKSTENGEKDVEKQVSEADSERTLQHSQSNVDNEVDEHGLHEVHISPYKIHVPSHIDVTDEELLVLQSLQFRLRTYDETGA